MISHDLRSDTAKGTKLLSVQSSASRLEQRRHRRFNTYLNSPRDDESRKFSEPNNQMKDRQASTTWDDMDTGTRTKRHTERRNQDTLTKKVEFDRTRISNQHDSIMKNIRGLNEPNRTKVFCIDGDQDVKVIGDLSHKNRSYGKLSSNNDQISESRLIKQKITTMMQEDEVNRNVLFSPRCSNRNKQKKKYYVVQEYVVSDNEATTEKKDNQSRFNQDKSPFVQKDEDKDLDFDTKSLSLLNDSTELVDRKRQTDAYKTPRKDRVKIENEKQVNLTQRNSTDLLRSSLKPHRFTSLAGEREGQSMIKSNLDRLNKLRSDAFRDEQDDRTDRSRLLERKHRSVVERNTEMREGLGKRLRPVSLQQNNTSIEQVKKDIKTLVQRLSDSLVIKLNDDSKSIEDINSPKRILSKQDSPSVSKVKNRKLYIQHSMKDFNQEYEHEDFKIVDQKKGRTGLDSFYQGKAAAASRNKKLSERKQQLSSSPAMELLSLGQLQKSKDHDFKISTGRGQNSPFDFGTIRQRAKITKIPDESPKLNLSQIKMRWTLNNSLISNNQCLSEIQKKTSKMVNNLISEDQSIQEVIQEINIQRYNEAKSILKEQNNASSQAEIFDTCKVQKSPKEREVSIQLNDDLRNSKTYSAATGRELKKSRLSTSRSIPKEVLQKESHSRFDRKMDKTLSSHSRILSTDNKSRSISRSKTRRAVQSSDPDETSFVGDRQAYDMVIGSPKREVKQKIKEVDQAIDRLTKSKEATNQPSPTNKQKKQTKHNKFKSLFSDHKVTSNESHTVQRENLREQRFPSKFTFYKAKDNANQRSSADADSLFEKSNEFEKRMNATITNEDCKMKVDTTFNNIQSHMSISFLDENSGLVGKNEKQKRIVMVEHLDAQNTPRKDNKKEQQRKEAQSLVQKIQDIQEMQLQSESLSLFHIKDRRNFDETDSKAQLPNSLNSTRNFGKPAARGEQNKEVSVPKLMSLEKETQNPNRISSSTHSTPFTKLNQFINKSQQLRKYCGQHSGRQLQQTQSQALVDQIRHDMNKRNEVEEVKPPRFLSPDNQIPQLKLKQKFEEQQQSVNRLAYPRGAQGLPQMRFNSPLGRRLKSPLSFRDMVASNQALNSQKSQPTRMSSRQWTNVPFLSPRRNQMEDNQHRTAFSRTQMDQYGNEQIVQNQDSQPRRRIIRLNSIEFGPGQDGLDRVRFASGLQSPRNFPQTTTGVAQPIRQARPSNDRDIPDMFYKVSRDHANASASRNYADIVSQFRSSKPPGSTSSLHGLERTSSQTSAVFSPRRKKSRRRESKLVKVIAASVYGDVDFLSGKRRSKAYFTSRDRETGVRVDFQQSIRNPYSAIFRTIYSFLEGRDPAGPSLDVFKMAVLNQQMKKITLSLYRVHDFKVFAEFEAKQRIVEVFKSRPNVDKYGYNPRAQRNIEAAWQSPVFGGSIFNPVRAARTGLGGLKETRPDGRKIEKKNSLKQQITTMPIDVHCGGGFYSLKNIQATENTFLDIDILIEGGVTNEADRELLRAACKPQKQIGSPRHESYSGCILMSDIKESSNQRLLSPPLTRADMILRQIQSNKDENIHYRNDQEPSVPVGRAQTHALRFDSPKNQLLDRHYSIKSPTRQVQTMQLNSPRNSRDAPWLDRSQFTQKAEIKHLLNGFARIIQYGTHQRDRTGCYNPNVSDRQNYLITIAEGHFQGGLFSGYVRSVDGQGDCMLGFWRVHQSVYGGPQYSRPFGKFAQYYRDGSFKMADGLYHGTQQCWNRLVKLKTITDYQANQDPNCEK